MTQSKTTGFTVLATPGNVEFRLHNWQPENPTALISFARSERGGALLLGNLHYRGELSKKLGGFAEPVSDAALVLAAFERWGKDAAAQIEGDFTLAVWDAQTGALTVARDIQGGYPAYYTRLGDTLAASTSLFALAELRQSVEFNRAYLADFLGLCDPTNELLTKDTAFTGINRIAPASLLRFDARTGAVESHSYWNWSAHLNTEISGNINEAGEQYREALTTAVRERMRGQTAAHFSGGMDATSVTMLAIENQQREQTTGPVHTLSMVYEKLPKLARERPFVEAAIDHAAGCIPHRIVGDQQLDFDAFKNPPKHEEPYAGLWRMAMDRRLLAEAERIGATSVLTGCGADELLDQKPFHLSGLVRQGRLIQAWKEASKWAYIRNCNAWSMLMAFGLQSWGIGATGQQTGFSAGDATPAWIHPAFRDEFRRRKLRSKRRQGRADVQDMLLKQSIAAVSERPGEVVRWSVAAPAGIHYSHPFQDRRVLKVALAALQKIPSQPELQKPLLTHAMKSRLPACISGRRSKGHFDEIFYLGLSRNLPVLEELAKSPALEQLEILDGRTFAKSLEPASLGGRNCRQLQPLIVSLCLACWVANQSAWRKQPVPVSHTFVFPLQPDQGAGSGRPNSYRGAIHA